MGGAVALKVHLKEPQNWDGVILVAPMCKIAEDVKPPPAVLKVLTLLANLMPEAKLFPTKDLAELAFRDLKKRKLVCLLVTYFLSFFHFSPCEISVSYPLLY